MRHAWGSRVGMVMLVGVMVLSAGLVVMADKALADKDDKDCDSATGLSGVTQNWDKNLLSASRFTVLAAFGGAAVRDNETGLVWEKAPQMSLETWDSARYTCVRKNVGGRKGWRLAAISELASLIDPTVAIPGPTLPPGHPFLNVQSSGYWSASTDAEVPSAAWNVGFGAGSVGRSTKTANGQVWCVRGGMNADTY
jgi:Protein of unknown function (DUF1566)